MKGEVYIERYQNKRHTEFITYDMELQISYSVCTEVPKKSVFWREKGSNREDPEAAVRVEGNRNPRSGNLSGSCTYAGEHTAEGIGIRLYGIPERKEQSDDLRAVREPEIQV